MEILNNKEIKLDRNINDLDRFALDFLKILRKYTDYVVVSGYVSILLGRARATDDIDVFIKPISKATFINLYNELKINNFWCLNAESDNEIFSYLTDGLSIRFARINQSVPNFEIKFPKDKLDEGSFDDFIMVSLKEGKIKISSLERQIAFKRFYLGTEKDYEDAAHIESKFPSLDISKVNKYEALIKKRKKESQNEK